TLVFWLVAAGLVVLMAAAAVAKAIAAGPAPGI
ncbi:rhomboid family intramembrane serine protease, partial [Burkholderia multivorans]